MVVVSYCVCAENQTWVLLKEQYVCLTDESSIISQDPCGGL